MKKALILACLILVLLACSGMPEQISAFFATPTGSPTITPEPTFTLTPSSMPEPTETPTELPSLTPEPAQSLTPTLVMPPLSPYPTVPNQLDCRLMWQSPGSGITYDPGEVFTVGWNVMNTGSETWDPSNVVFTYLGGNKMYDYPLVKLKSSVSPGEQVVLSVGMRAPKNSTFYTTYWSLREGNTFFCILTVSIYVK